jgi:hypothetical protein
MVCMYTLVCHIMYSTRVHTYIVVWYGMQRNAMHYNGMYCNVTVRTVMVRNEMVCNGM